MYYYTGFSFFKIGIDILSRALGQVPSAQVGLTSLFGMGRGDPHRNKRHKTLFCVGYLLISCPIAIGLIRNK
jgi:hypothetical protein